MRPFFKVYSHWREGIRLGGGIYFYGGFHAELQVLGWTVVAGWDHEDY